MGKYSVAMVKEKTFINPVICIIAAAFFSNILLNILIYQKRRKNEKQDKNCDSCLGLVQLRELCQDKNCKRNKRFNNRVPKSLWSLLVNFLQLALTVTVSVNNTILQRYNDKFYRVF